ncbi:MAG: reprolysin-like metallopeptidase, partial [Vicinamibacteria bacterium]
VAALAGESVRLELFADARFEAVRERLVPLGPDGFVWIGHAAGDESSSIVLSAWHGVVSASVRTASAQFRVRPSGFGLHRVEEIAASWEAPDREPLTPSSLSLVPAKGLDDGSTIDLLVVYTPRARRASGGADAMASLVALGIAETNLALEQSGVATRLRLVELRELSYREAGRVESDLEILKEERDGALDEAHALRDAFGADLVMLVVEERDGCGVSYSMGGAGAAFADWAYSVVERGCIDSTYAMAHELGHNLGCDHAPEDPTTKGAFAFSFGYKDLASGIRTIMAYGPGRRVPRFSNPRIPFVGRKLGTEQQDNARSLNELRTTASRFRSSVPPPRLLSSPGSARESIRFRVVSDAGPALREWRLFLGTAPGHSDRLDSGTRDGIDSIETRDPASGNATVHGRLWYRRGSVWLYEDFTL